MGKGRVHNTVKTLQGNNTEKKLYIEWVMKVTVTSAYSVRTQSDG